MKKLIITSAVAALAFVSVAAASFDSNLTVGSTGTSVTALQTALISAGFDIPSVSAGTAAKGYFGQQTKTAVIAYQKSKALPTTGFVGPMTRAALNGSATVVVNPSTTCPVGYTCTVTPGTTVTTTVTTPTSLGNTDGSISVSQSSYVSTGIQVKKGETKDVVAVRLQATAGPVNVSRFDVHFSVRPWLFFSQVTLHDSNGKILATKNISSYADATEITVGTDYLVRFDGLAYTVTPGTNPDIAVGVSVLAATDKITTGLTVNAGIPAGSIRTINGLGFTDSVGGNVSFGAVGAGESTFTFGSASANQADIYTRVSPTSNPIEHPQAISLTQVTPSVSLGSYSLKAQNQSGTLNNVAFTIQTNPAFGSVTGMFSNIRLQDGSQSYGGTVANDGKTVNFTNLTIALSQDFWKDLTIVADVAATSSTVRASSTLIASSINGTDVNYNNLGVSNASNQTASNVVLSTNSISASAMSASIYAGIADVANGPIQRYPVTYTFTLTNNSSNTLYVPASAGSLVSVVNNPVNASSTIYLVEPVAAANGDTATSYAIAAGGGTRTFTVDGTIKKSSNASTGESMRISAINYFVASDLSGTQQVISSGLESLYKSATF